MHQAFCKKREKDWLAEITGNNTRFSKQMHMQHKRTYEKNTSSVYTPPVTHKHTPRKHTQCIQTLMRTDFLQQTRYDEMDTADQPQQKLNNTVRRPFPFSLTWHPPTQLHLLLFHHYHLFSFLRSPLPHQSSSSSLFPPFSSASCLPPLVSDLKHTPRQTLEKSDGPDQTYVLNYNPSE